MSFMLLALFPNWSPPVNVDALYLWYKLPNLPPIWMLVQTLIWSPKDLHVWLRDTSHLYFVWLRYIFQMFNHNILELKVTLYYPCSYISLLEPEIEGSESRHARYGTSSMHHYLFKQSVPCYTAVGERNSSHSARTRVDT